MTTTLYRPLRKEDIISVLALDLREQDRKEARAFAGCSTAEALMYSLQHSIDVFVVIHKDKIEGVFGVSLEPGRGAPWFVATDAFKDFSFTFCKESRNMVEWMLKRYEYLENYVDSRNETAIKWLSWLGFNIDYDEEHYFWEFNVPFYRFSKTQKEQ